jgi:predicted GTPase
MEKEKMTEDFPIVKMIKGILKGSKKASEEEKEELIKKIEEEITNKPFNVAVIGQGGVGKTSMMQTVFGIENGRIRAVQEGTLIEKTYDFFKGFSLKVTDFPGLNNDYKKDRDIYIPLYKEKLPQNDLIMYVMDINKAIGDDVQILKDIVIPICKESGNTRNIIIVLNKIDMIGQAYPEYHTDKNLHWDIVNNQPTTILFQLIQNKVEQIKEKFEEAGILKEIDSIRIPEISAIYAYNQSKVIDAIIESERGWVFLGSIASKVMKDPNQLKTK